MPWLRLEEGFAENSKVEALSDRAFRLHVTALCHCARNLTDGLLSVKAVKVCGILAGNSRPMRNVQELVDVGLWHEEGDGWAINDFTQYNPSSDEVKQRRKANSERQKKWRESHRDDVTGKFQSDTVHDAVSNALHNATPSRPVPSPSEVQEPADPADDDYGRSGAIKRLMDCLTDKDDATRAQVRRYVESRSLSVGDIEWARECASGPGVRSPTRVAVAELQKRAGERSAA